MAGDPNMPPIISTSWCSDSLGISSFWVWVRPVTCFQPIKCDHILLVTEVPSVSRSLVTVAHLLLANSPHCPFDAAAAMLGRPHGKGWGWPPANSQRGAEALAPAFQEQPHKTLPQLSLRVEPQPQLTPWLKPVRDPEVQDTVKLCLGFWPTNTER